LIIIFYGFFEGLPFYETSLKRCFLTAINELRLPRIFWPGSDPSKITCPVQSDHNSSHSRRWHFSIPYSLFAIPNPSGSRIQVYPELRAAVKRRAKPMTWPFVRSASINWIARNQNQTTRDGGWNEMGWYGMV